MDTCFSLFQFAQQEEKRQKAERLHQQQKHETQMKDMQAQCESNTNELQQLQVLILVAQSLRAASVPFLRQHREHVLRSGCRGLSGN